MHNWQYTDNPARVLRLKRVAGRLMEMVKSSGPDNTGTWAREAAVFPTFDQPNKPKKSRRLFSLQGSTLVPDDEHIETGILKVITQQDHPLGQATPLEMPTEFYKLKGKVMNVETIFCELVRAAGGSITTSRAPRGNMARKLMNK